MNILIGTFVVLFAILTTASVLCLIAWGIALQRSPKAVIYFNRLVELPQHEMSYWDMAYKASFYLAMSVFVLFPLFYLVAILQAIL